ncbi:MAG TPA: CBS domain-containing protein [Longimicrobiales bacterium]|nr:CBS domain-containing protein [Longimicrobiales bacterium]
MSTGKICTRDVYTGRPGESVREAAERMADHGVGTLVILGEDDLPVGIVTDRDIVVRCVAEDLDPQWTTVSEVMSTPPNTVREDTPIEEALQKMASARVRRAIVVDPLGGLVGLLSLDDALDLLAEEAQTIGKLIRAQSAVAGAR